MKLPETNIKVVTSPPTDSYINFSIECRRDVSHINKAVAKGYLNWGNVYGLKVVVLDDLAEAFKNKCRALDASKRVVNASKTDMI